MKEGASNRFWNLDLIILALLAGFSIAFMIDARTYNPTAALFPRLVSSVTFILLFISIVQRFWSFFKKDRPVPRPEEVNPSGAKRGLGAGFSLLVMMGYFFSIYLIGMIGASLLYLCLMPLFMGYRKYKVVFLTSAMWIAAFVFVFAYILHARIPAGFLGNVHQWFGLM